MNHHTAEGRRLEDSRRGKAPWHQWGPYLSDRAWGTVREDYSALGDAWQYFPHDHARSRAYRWNEDGLGGICDNRQYLCFALALWNGSDPILKERFFGLGGPEGNHGEDVKEYYFYLDSTPTHSYMKMLYKYPQAAFPYDDLVETNRRRSKLEPEYELLDTGVFGEDRYFDVLIEYAKVGPADVLVRISATNHGPQEAGLHLLPTLWFRNTWSWGDPDETGPRPQLWWQDANETGAAGIGAEHHRLGRYLLACEGQPQVLFTENDTNQERLFGLPNPSSFVKDGIGEAVVQGRQGAVNPARSGTKAAAHYELSVPAGATAAIRLRLTQLTLPDGQMGTAHAPASFAGFDTTFEQRRREADEFYSALQPETLTDEERDVQRQAWAGMLWSKQFYYFDVAKWLDGDPGQPPPPAGRRDGRNRDWAHLNTADILSMPDKWEYPWFAAWDLAFHCLPLARLDPEFAKQQLLLLGREWYQHPNGQLPAYEWAFGDVNPPVVSWAAWEVYRIERELRGEGDRTFLERVFHKLLLNFTWWVNRKDAEGRNVFQGGFLGMDNIGVFDRNTQLPDGSHIEQSDGTAWMAMFCLNMLRIAVELAQANRAYEDIAIKFFEHFLYIAEAMNDVGGDGISLWHEEDEFFYDVLHRQDGSAHPLMIRSMVGLIPLFAVTVLDPELRDNLPEFKRHQQWFLEHRPKLARLVSRWHEPGMKERSLLAVLRGHRMKRVLSRMLDETEFLSRYGVRSISSYHRDHPYLLDTGGQRMTVAYQPAESDSGFFGGNSNWRGPVWFPVNYLIVAALREFHRYYGDDFRVECPTGSGRYLSLADIADDLAGRLVSIFLPDPAAGNRRPVYGSLDVFQRDRRWGNFILFHEYFHGDNGAGIGANHQTGWTGLVAELIQERGRRRLQSKPSTAERNEQEQQSEEATPRAPA